VLLEFQLLRPRAKFGAYFMFEAYFSMYISCLVEKKGENIFVTVETELPSWRHRYVIYETEIESIRPVKQEKILCLGFVMKQSMK